MAKTKTRRAFVRAPRGRAGFRRQSRNLPLLPLAAIGLPVANSLAHASNNGGILSAQGAAAGFAKLQDMMDPRFPDGQRSLTMLGISALGRAVGVNPRVRLGKWSISAF